MDCEDYMTDDELMDLADFFKNFADSTRLKILFLLQEGEFSVNEIASRLGMGQRARAPSRVSSRPSRPAGWYGHARTEGWSTTACATST